MYNHVVNIMVNGYELAEQVKSGKVNINDYTENDKRIVQALLENSLYRDFFELKKQIEDQIRTKISRKTERNTRTRKRNSENHGSKFCSWMFDNGL